MNNVFLIEDHNEALKVWREKKIKDLDLVHLDAHIDFGFYQANPIEQVFKEAKSLRELKRNLEKNLAFKRYEKDFNKQTNIGNYIYPAMCEGIVKDFYWVVPGGLKEFKTSYKIIKNMLKSIARQDPYQSNHTLLVMHKGIKDGIISTKFLGRKFVICTLEKLSVLEQKVLLDIDTDFLVIDNLLNADNTKNIGQREPWILPQDLVNELKKKIRKPQVVTIAYSVNGGFTPMKYRHLGDEIAYRFSSQYFKERFRRSFKAREYFEHFNLTGRKQDYWKAISLNPAYRAFDNNYGPLYLRLRKLSQAEKEFKKIAKVDSKNPHPFSGLGEVYLQRRNFHKARQYFSYALRHKKELPSALFGLAHAEFGLKNFKKAKGLFCRYRVLRPLEPQSYYLLGYIYEKEKKFQEAIAQYQDALRLGLNDIDVLQRLLKFSYYGNKRCDIIKFVITRYKEFKKELNRVKRSNLKKERRVKGLHRVEEKMLSLERSLGKIKQEKEV